MLLKDIAVAIGRKQNNMFTYPIEKQRKYIEKLGKPTDEIERGYFQYCCQMKLYRWPLFALLNVAALPLSLLYLLRFCKKKVVPEEKAECIFFYYGLPENIIPNTLKKRYSQIRLVQDSDICIDGDDLQFLKKIFKRYPFSWMLWLKVIIKIARYSGAIKRYMPDAVLCCNEYSFTSSVMTKYCREKGVRLINTMHGEKLYCMRDSFVCFDEYYVWNEHYKNLLIELGAEPTQFRIEVPDSLKIPANSEVQKEYDFTYYLGEEDNRTLAIIASLLSKLKAKGYKVAIRPHPRYANMDEVKQLFAGLYVEDSRNLPIERSLQQTKNAMSLYSTVLMQAHYSGINVVIDDVSAPGEYAKLRQLSYYLLATEHKLLSEILAKAQ